MYHRKHFNYQFSAPYYHTLHEIAQKLGVSVKEVRKVDMRKEIIELNTGLKIKK